MQENEVRILRSFKRKNEVIGVAGLGIGVITGEASIFSNINALNYVFASSLSVSIVCLTINCLINARIEHITGKHEDFISN
ncbi:hypothetical protein BH10PAT1_BH10PAT1_7890 [soil metagenome]